MLHLPIDDFLAMHGQPIDDDMRSVLEPLIGHLALSDAINLAWIVLAVASAVVALACLAMRIKRPAARSSRISNGIERLG
jgi:DHA2 family multidrug resistance protein